MPLFYWPYLESVRKEIVVMIIKHHTNTHCTFRLYINIHKLYLRTKCKKLYKVRQAKIFFESANCTLDEQLQNRNAPLVIWQS